MKTYIILFLILTLVSADEDTNLSRTICRETNNPTLCLKCLDSDPSADVATGATIAASMMTCLRSEGASIGARMAGIASESPDLETKRVFGECGASYAASNTDLAAAAELVRSGEAEKDYDSAEKVVAGALSRQYSCLEEIKELKNKVELEPELGYEISVYEELCNVSERIIERL